MGIFGFWENKKILDLTEREKIVKNPRERTFPFRDDEPQEGVSFNKDLNSEEKKRNLAKRISSMIEKIENLSNEIYHLQQRIEVLEKKSNINKLE